MTNGTQNLDNRESGQIHIGACYASGLSFLNQINCIDWVEGIKAVENESVDLVVTDPPYGMAYRSNRRAEKHKAIKNDNNLNWLSEWRTELKRVCKPEAHLYIFCTLVGLLSLLLAREKEILGGSDIEVACIGVLSLAGESGTQCRVWTK